MQLTFQPRRRFAAVFFRDGAAVGVDASGDVGAERAPGEARPLRDALGSDRNRLKRLPKYRQIVRPVFLNLWMELTEYVGVLDCHDRFGGDWGAGPDPIRRRDRRGSDLGVRL